MIVRRVASVVAVGWLGAVCLALLGACARVPPQLQGTFPPVTVADAQRDPKTGERVRWGGEIVSTTPQAGDTCLEVVSKPLACTTRPRGGDETFGRFVACAPGFYDPAIYAPKRDVTVVGTLEPGSQGKVGEADYTFARLRAETVYLWPARDPVERVYAPYGWGWGYPGWGWGLGWGGYWGGPFRGGPRFIGRRISPGRR